MAASLLLVVLMVAVALWYAGWPSIRRDATVTAATYFDLLKLVFAVVAGVGGVAALVVAYRRQRVAEHTSKLAEFAHRLAHAADLRAEVTKALAEAADQRANIETDRNGVRLLNERFAKAAEQLGSDKAAVRLAGVYAMAGLADDWTDGRQTCVDVLCAYLRMPYVPPKAPTADAEPLDADAGAQDSVEGDSVAREEREVRHTVLRSITRHLRLPSEDPTSWQGLDFDFTGAVLDGGDFSGAIFSDGTVSFSGANFCGSVYFMGAKFTGAHITFSGATFSSGRVYLLESEFIKGHVSFDRAKIRGGEVFLAASDFKGAGVSFDDAHINGGGLYFNLSRFTEGKVTFAGATISDGKVEFKAAKFNGGTVAFDWTVFAGGEVSFRDAVFDGGEVDLRKARIVVGADPVFDSWPGEGPPGGLHLPAA
ncbi:hypothetical protein C8054_14975 [Micromonospora sp. RP3T]|nr:hypothetical protein C8054_14975 [Micromonospora sp. RP3T]